MSAKTQKLPHWMLKGVVDNISMSAKSDCLLQSVAAREKQRWHTPTHDGGGGDWELWSFKITREIPTTPIWEFPPGNIPFTTVPITKKAFRTFIPEDKDVVQVIKDWRLVNITKACLHLHSSKCKLHLMRWIRWMLYFSGSLESVRLAPDLNFDWNSSVCAQLDQQDEYWPKVVWLTFVLCGFVNIE